MLEQILRLLESSSTFVLTTHTRPDGDAIGSQLALGLFLESKGKEVLFLNHDRTPYTLDWMPGVDRIQRFDGSLTMREAIAAADVLIVLDTNNEERLGDVGPSFRAAQGAKVLFDHHTAPESWFDFAEIREHASSTGEIIYDLLTAWDARAIDHGIAAALYVAVMTDTGSFRFSNVSGDVHRLVGDLIDKGHLDVSKIHSDVYYRRSSEGLKLLSRVLATLALHHEGQIGSMIISRRMLGETGANIEEADGFVNHILTIEGVRVALLFTETERGTKVSFRSTGEAHVHLWSQALGGGGHRNAAGAFVRKPLEETMDLVIGKAPKYIALARPTAAGEEDLAAEDREYLSSLLKMQTRGSDG